MEAILTDEEKKKRARELLTTQAQYRSELFLWTSFYQQQRTVFLAASYVNDSTLNSPRRRRARRRRLAPTPYRASLPCPWRMPPPRLEAENSCTQNCPNIRLLLWLIQNLQLEQRKLAILYHQTQGHLKAVAEYCQAYADELSALQVSGSEHRRIYIPPYPQRPDLLTAAGTFTQLGPPDRQVRQPTPPSRPLQTHPAPPQQAAAWNLSSFPQRRERPPSPNANIGPTSSRPESPLVAPGTAC